MTGLFYHLGLVLLLALSLGLVLNLFFQQAGVSYY